MGALVAVAVGRAGADGRVADVVAGQDAPVPVGAIVRGEDIHDVVDAGGLRGFTQLGGHPAVVGEAAVLGEDGNLLLVGILLGSGRRDVQGQDVVFSPI